MSRYYNHYTGRWSESPSLGRGFRGPRLPAPPPEKEGPKDARPITEMERTAAVMRETDRIIQEIRASRKA